MKYFWHFLVAAGAVTLLTVLFFVFSLDVKNNINFTNEIAITEPTITTIDPSLGPLGAAVTIVSFGDYGCASCADLDASLTTLHTTYPNDVRIVWKDMPNTSQHPEALNAAMAARCAGEQKKFWEYHTLLMANQPNLGADLYTEIATELGLRDNAFTRCLDSQTTLPFVQHGFEEGVSLGITATPTFYLNNTRYTGSMSTSEIKRLVDTALATR